MANVMFKKGLLAGLPSTYAEGTFYVTTDERAIYLDVDNSTRIRLGDFQEFETLAALQANTNPSTSALCYISGLNVLAKWNGTEYVQINLDTGATSVEVVGDGNAVTAVSYDATTRKLTLTKGETFATRAYVGEIPEGYTEATVIAYINKKAEEVLSAAQGGSSETAASVKQALDTYKAATEPRLEALEAVDHDHANKELLDTYTQTEANLADAVAKKHEHANAEELAKIVDGDKAKWDKAVTDLADEIARAKAAEEDNADAAADALAEAQAKVASVGAGDNSVTMGGTSTAPTVAVKLSQDADNAMELAEDGLKVVIPAAAEYTIEKAADSGDYAAVYALKKDGVQVGTSINIPKDMVVESGSVVENPEGQAEGTYIKLVLQNVAEPLYINVGSLIEYVTSGSQAGDMVVISVSDDHKVTATITDGSITLAKLATDVQTAIGKAHSHDNKTVLDGITEDKVNAWDAAEQNAKGYADGLNTAMNERVEDLEAIDHEAYKAYADQAEADALAAAKEYADGLAGNYDEAGSADQALTDAKAYADGLAGNYDAAGAAATAESNAKAYADGLADNYDASGAAAAVQGETDKTVKDVVDILTWGSF